MPYYYKPFSTKPELVMENETKTDKSGKVNITVDTSIAKELFGRRSNFSNITDWKSFMNDSDDNDGVPTLIDRAVYHLRQVSQKNRYYYKISYYGEEQTIDNL